MSALLADVVIFAPVKDVGTRITQFGKTIMLGHVTPEAAELLVIGAAYRKLSVYDERTGKFLAGSLEELDKRELN